MGMVKLLNLTFTIKFCGLTVLTMGVLDFYGQKLENFTKLALERLLSAS